MSIKNELRLIREKCPIVWNRFYACEYPNGIDDDLVNSYGIDDYGDTYCDIGSEEGYCEKCWDKALGYAND